MFGSDVKFTVIPMEGEPYTVPLTLKVAIAFEREYKTTISVALAGEPSAEHLAWCAWKSTQNTGRIVKPFEGWLDSEILDITLDGDDPK